MTHHTMGAFVLYREAGSRTPLWPAVVCPDDVAPQDFLDTHPGTYVHLILLMGKLVFRWAQTSELHDYDPFIPVRDEAIVGNTPGLSEAYMMSSSALEDGLGLDHWRQRVNNDVMVISSDSDTTGEDSDADSGEDTDDSEIRWAKRQSKLDFAKEKRASTLLSSPLQRAKRQSTPLTISDSEEEDLELRLPPPPRTPFRSTLRTPNATPNVPTRRIPSRSPKHRHDRFLSSQKRNAGPDKKVRSTVPAPQTRQTTISFAPKITNGLDLRQLDRLPTAPNSDIIEGDIEASKAFVQVRVGSEGKNYSFQKSKVWNRAYFRDPTAGLMHFSISDNGVYQLTHPGLVAIEPEDFTFVAQYLENGSFGYHRPSKSEMREASAQCMSAWASAEKLGMTDLMDHIVDKLELLGSPDRWDLLAFAGLVYKSPAISLPAQVRIKDILATDIAQYYWDYVDDDSLSALFMQRLKDLPELERDVSVKRIDVLNAWLEEDAE